MGKCKGCGAELAWGKTREGKTIPLDTKAPTYRMVGGVLERSDARVTHFSTCPAANQFSGAGRKRAAQLAEETAAASDADREMGGERPWKDDA